MKHLKNQRGFTLIELIIVIVVLGILAAVAIPQYVNLTTDAVQASNMGYMAGVKSTLSIDYSGQRLGRTVGTGANQVCADATTTGAVAVPAATTNTQVQSCITGGLPTGTGALATSGTLAWTGAAALTAGGIGTTQTWTLTAGTNAADPVYIRCTIGTLRC